jgi:hypothetical protein
MTASRWYGWYTVSADSQINTFETRKCALLALLLNGQIIVVLRGTGTVIVYSR